MRPCLSRSPGRGLSVVDSATNDSQLADFERRVGTERLEEFVDEQWGDGAATHAGQEHQCVEGLLLSGQP
jgi:hypothetical protein